MNRIISEVGPFKATTQRDRFGSLVKSIVSQQISREAAVTIMERLKHALLPDKISPESLLNASEEQFVGVGLSGQKKSYLLSLANGCVNGDVNLARIGRNSDDEVIAELTQIKGIGVWTAHMFLIFSLGRLDILPVGDLAIQMSIQQQYGLQELPTAPKMNQIAEPWRPYATVASWYLWRIRKP